MRILFVLLFSFYLNSVNGQDKEHQRYLDNGDAAKLSSFFSKKVDLKVPNSKGIYSKKQAELVMADFFDDNLALKYNVKHYGGSKAKAKFEIGELVNKEKKYRTYLLYQTNDSSLQIIELRIEPED
ncbi:MAG: DUF4783 domain-containing protein [Vicingaceae bacterium]